MENVKAGVDMNMETEIAEFGSGRETDIASGKTELKEDSDSFCESILTDPSNPREDIQLEPPSAENTKHGNHSAKPLLSYIALIAKVILSSPSQKLNLASIYRAMEEQFPYFQARGQGWRNSVRHNLSLNNCFVKVSRCEDGKGHYWGIHPAYLGNFLLGDFRQQRRARRSRWEKELQASVTKSLGWLEPHCYWERYCGRGIGSPGLVSPHWPLLEPRGYVTGPVDLTGPFYDPWKLHGVGSLSWVRPYYSPERLQNVNDRTSVERWCYGQPVTPTWTQWIAERCMSHQGVAWAGGKSHVATSQ